MDSENPERSDGLHGKPFVRNHANEKKEKSKSRWNDAYARRVAANEAGRLEYTDMTCDTHARREN